MSPVSNSTDSSPLHKQSGNLRVAALAARVALWSATRPSLVLTVAAVLLLLSLFSLSRLHITSSLAGMLGTNSPTAAAMQRVTTEYRTGDALLLLVELPTGRANDEAGKAQLVEFATRLAESLKLDEALSPLIAWVRFRDDPEFLRFAREVMLPNGAYYLSDDAIAELALRLSPQRIREQIERNEAMIGAPGPSGAALSGAVLKDPLRLLELIPPELKGGEAGGNVLAAGGQPDEGRPEFSEDERALLIHIGATRLGSDYEAASRLVDAVVKRAAELNTSELRIEPAGFAAIARDSSRVIRRDAIVSCVASVGLLYLLFLAFYRRWSAGLVIGGVASTGMLIGIGVLSLTIKEISPLAAMIAALLAGLGTDYGIHFVSHYDGFRQKGLSSVDACAQTAQHMAVPIVTNCFTSIFGFISLWPSQIQMLRDFAVLGAAGLIGALVAVFVLMPAVLALIDRHATATPSDRALFGKLSDVVASRPRLFMVTSLAALGLMVTAAAFQGFSVRFESDLTVMHPRPTFALNTTGEVIRRFSSQGELVPIDIRSATPEGLAAVAHDVATALASPQCRAVGVTGVIGLHTLVPDPRNSQRRSELLEKIDPNLAVASFDAAINASLFDPAAYVGYREFLRTLLSSRHAPTVDDIIQYPGVAERVFPITNVEQGIASTSTVLVARLSAPLHDRAQRKAAIGALKAAAAKVQSGEVTVAGIAAVSEELEEAARNGLPQSVAISFVLVLGWLIFVFRRPLDVLLALVPLLFATGTTVLVIIALGQEFNPINSIAIPLLDGIAVDAGVFLVSAYRSHHGQPAQLRIYLRSTTHAVLLSVGTTVTAFAALCFTNTPAIRSLGLVSAIGIAASGVGALFLLMPILTQRARRNAAK